jgi:hypothetical protein
VGTATLEQALARKNIKTRMYMNMYVLFFIQTPFHAHILQKGCSENVQKYFGLRLESKSPR